MYTFVYILTKKPDDVTIINSYIFILNKIKSRYISVFYFI